MLIRSLGQLTRAAARSSRVNAPSISMVRHCSGKPTIEDAQAAPTEIYQMSNEAIAIMAASGDSDAIEERLVREIMRVDSVSWDGAQDQLQIMAKANHSGMFLLTLPYKLGIAGGFFVAASTIPLCFSLDTALWFNEAFVTTDVPEDADLETWLEVGSWTWNWMEPPLGQASFFLLCLQYMRAQMQNVGFKPYTDSVKSYRANSLINAFPQYNRSIVEDFSLKQNLIN